MIHFKKPRIALWLGLIGLIVIIFFAAAQQYYYLVRFNLDDPENISFVGILSGQSYQWLIWTFFGFLLWKFMPVLLNSNGNKLTKVWQYGLALLVIVTLNILVISCFRLLINGEVFSVSRVYEYFTFHIFQKSPIFLIAFSCLMVVYHLILNQDVLELKLTELVDLKESNQSLYKALNEQMVNDSTAMIQVKTGHRLKYLPVTSIRWIQADDYCVRIHDQSNQVFTIRTSMKTLENELPDNLFFRIHRKSIVNLRQVVEFQSSIQPTVVMDNGLKLEVAFSRVKKLKMQMGKQPMPNIQNQP